MRTRILVGVVSGLVVVMLAVAVAVAPPHHAGTKRVTSAIGGFSLAVPDDWDVTQARPTNENASSYARGRNTALFGLDHTEGFFVVRFGRAAHATLDSTAADIERAVARRTAATRTFVRGNPAVAVTYRNRDQSLVDHVLRRRQQWLIVAFFVDTFVFEIGTWSSTGAPNEDVARSFRYAPPRPWTVHVDTAQVTLPGGWIQARPPIDAAFHAWSPGDPIDAWAYVFHFTTVSLSDEIADAQHNIAKRGGTNIAVAPRRLDFLFPDEGHAQPAHDTEWFAPDGLGGTYVLAVGYRSGDPTIGEQIATTFRVS